MRVMPICTVDKKRLGFSERRKAACAPLLPFLEALSSLNFREETKDISAMEKIPLSNTKPIIIKISMLML